MTSDDVVVAFVKESINTTGNVSLGEDYSKNYCLESGLLMSADRTILLGVFVNQDSVCIPNTVDTIYHGCFHTKLNEVSFENCSQ